MTTINNELELYTLKGNVTAGKILLFQSLEKEGNDKEQIEHLVVDEYEIMQPKHFVRSWKEYTKTKRFINWKK